ncbi:hypothetical protein [Lentilactobacillus sp. SPB1-3]|uniref:Uncharacterized protein n=1 Tax=Lentilactobacillus terminaliae TaxID=3003483 RepID=A0ACD5DCY6_9LACO|nr:hypothetical protein [Lentilactobacillus sp. SPB1-3]MCZ0978031.1 hypothetical protein [Lentilactobacillus sp. SPB1-3]
MEKSLKPISIPPKRHAATIAQSSYNTEPVGVKVKSIKYIGHEDVYNMEVENHHNFSVNGGFIVHNCADAMRYFCMTVLPPEQDDDSGIQMFSNY